MTTRIWDKFLTERDKTIFAASGYGARGGFGARPALLVIDMNYGFVGDKPEPIMESIKRWMNSCGEDGWKAIEGIKPLLSTARAKGIPVIYTTGVRRSDGWDQGSWLFKNNRATTDYNGLDKNLPSSSTIIPDIAPAPTDLLIGKKKPSGFYGTPLASFLVQLQCDSVIVTGATTSGCVRATVVDAFSYNFRVAVVEDGCADRSEASHAINLCDMNAKYADVVSSSETQAYLESLPEGMFKLPTGRGNPMSEGLIGI